MWANDVIFHYFLIFHLRFKIKINCEGQKAPSQKHVKTSDVLYFQTSESNQPWSHYGGARGSNPNNCGSSETSGAKECKHHCRGAPKFQHKEVYHSKNMTFLKIQKFFKISYKLWKILSLKKSRVSLLTIMPIFIKLRLPFLQNC